MEPFLKMDNQMVLIMPYIAKFDVNAMRIIKAPILIDLPMLNPMFEYYVNQLLAKVSTIIYAQTAKYRTKFSHIRGYVLCNLNEDLKDYIAVNVLELGSTK